MSKAASSTSNANVVTPALCVYIDAQPEMLKRLLNRRIYTVPPLHVHLV